MFCLVDLLDPGKVAGGKAVQVLNYSQSLQEIRLAGETNCFKPGPFTEKFQSGKVYMRGNILLPHPLIWLFINPMVIITK